MMTPHFSLLEKRVNPEQQAVHRPACLHTNQLANQGLRPPGSAGLATRVARRGDQTPSTVCGACVARRRANKCRSRCWQKYKCVPDERPVNAHSIAGGITAGEEPARRRLILRQCLQGNAQMAGGYRRTGEIVPQPSFSRSIGWQGVRQTAAPFRALGRSTASATWHVIAAAAAPASVPIGAPCTLA